MEPTPFETPTMPPTEQPVAEPAQTIHKNASWGAIFTIIVILAMITIGAYYEWGRRLEQQRQYQAEYFDGTAQ